MCWALRRMSFLSTRRTFSISNRQARRSARRCTSRRKPRSSNLTRRSDRTPRRRLRRRQPGGHSPRHRRRWLRRLRGSKARTPVLQRQLVSTRCRHEGRRAPFHTVPGRASSDHQGGRVARKRRLALRSRTWRGLSESHCWIKLDPWASMISMKCETNKRKISG